MVLVLRWRGAGGLPLSGCCCLRRLCRILVGIRLLVRPRQVAVRLVGVVVRFLLRHRVPLCLCLDHLLAEGEVVEAERVALFFEDLRTSLEG